MKTVNLVIHMVNGALLSLFGMIMLLMGLLGAAVTLLFSGGVTGFLFLMAAGAALAIGVLSFVFGVRDLSLLREDPVRYRKYELILDVGSVAVWFVGMLLLAAYNNFSIPDLFAHGFGGFFVFLAGMIGLNAVAVFFAISASSGARL